MSVMHHEATMSGKPVHGVDPAEGGQGPWPAGRALIHINARQHERRKSGLVFVEEQSTVRQRQNIVS